MVIKPRFDEEKEELVVQAEQVLLLNVGNNRSNRRDRR